jgi:glycerol-1-phosphate dehydrogenase [NAD(P)+]
MVKAMDRLGWHSLGTSFACSCGVTHRIPVKRAHIGTDAAARMADFARETCGATCLVVSDANTRHAAGDKPFSALSRAGKKIVEKTYGGEPLDATEDLAQEVARAGAGADFYVSVGAGTITDLAKYAGDKQGKPVLAYPTAASMNGYTSAIVALKVRGLKRTLPCAPVTGVFADPETAARAPQRMTAAGVGDFLSKASSGADWRASHLLRDAYFCERPRELFEGSQDQVLAEARAIGEGSVEGLAVLLNALLLSGLSMVVAGSSAPASGGEHLISHYLDMKSALYGTGHDLHGAQVGVATLYCLELWERILDLDAQSIQVDALTAGQPSSEQVREWVGADWGQTAPEVMLQWEEKALDKQAIRKELVRLQRGLADLRHELGQDLLPRSEVSRAIHEAGGPTDPEGLTAPLEEYLKAQRFARFLRNRFTVLDLAAELLLG